LRLPENFRRFEGTEIRLDWFNLRIISRDKMNKRILPLCGMLAPFLFILIAVLGGAIRPGYSHMAETVSELFSPGSTNKPLLDSLYTAFAFLLIGFGVGILRFVGESGVPGRIGIIGAYLYIFMGILTVFSATLFPQDPWGSLPTFRGQMHIYIHGLITVISLFSIAALGRWFSATGIIPKFGIYSYITIITAIITAAFYVVSMDTPVMGLTERIAAFIGFQWTFVLAVRLFSR